jgi:hypothetical protein
MRKILGLSLCFCIALSLSFIPASAAPPVVDKTKALKPAAAFSADGEYLGLVLGSGDNAHHLMIYNEKLNYRFIISNGTGLMAYQGSRPAYSTEETCTELYITKNRYEDFIQGANDEFGTGTWPYGTKLVTTDSTLSVQQGDIKYQRIWQQLTKTEPMLMVFCNSFPPPDCSLCNGGIDDYGAPLTPSNNDCLGYRKQKTYLTEPCVVNGVNTNCAVMAWACSPASLTGSTPYHKVVPFTMSLPFKYPVAIPIEIKVNY